MKYQYQKVIKVTNYSHLSMDLQGRIQQYLMVNRKNQWKTATQILREMGFTEITQRETRAACLAMQKLGIKCKKSSGFKWFL